MPTLTFPLGDDAVVRVEYGYPLPHDSELYDKIREAKKEEELVPGIQPKISKPWIREVNVFGKRRPIFDHSEWKEITAQINGIPDKEYTPKEIYDYHHDKYFGI